MDIMQFPISLYLTFSPVSAYKKTSAIVLDKLEPSLATLYCSWDKLFLYLLSAILTNSCNVI